MLSKQKAFLSNSDLTNSFIAASFYSILVVHLLPLLFLRGGNFGTCAIRSNLIISQRSVQNKLGKKRASLFLASPEKYIPSQPLPASTVNFPKRDEKFFFLLMSINWILTFKPEKHICLSAVPGWGIFYGNSSA